MGGNIYDTSARSLRTNDYIFVTCLDNNPFLNILESEKLIDRLQLAETIASRLNTKLYGISVGKNRENKFSLKEMQKS